MKRVWLILCAVTVFVSACTTETFPVLIPSAEELIAQNPGAAAERAALVALYEATDGANWTHYDNWLSAAPVAAWYGVVTDASGRVIELNLPANGLIGSIPDLNALTSLTYLDLGYNRLSGFIPDMSALVGLSWLSLDHNQLTGPVPDLSALTGLSRLFLGANGLTGPVPDLSTLTSLSWLNLRGNLLCLPEGAVLSGSKGAAAVHLQSLNLPACAGAQRPQSPAAADERAASFPSCPTDNVYEYLLCARPTYNTEGFQTPEETDKAYRNMEEILNFHCVEPATEWLPVLESSVRTSIPDARKFLESKPEFHRFDPTMFTTEGRELESLGKQELYSAVVAMYLFDPTQKGTQGLVDLHRKGAECLASSPISCRNPKNESCVSLFDHLRDGGLIKWMNWERR